MTAQGEQQLRDQHHWARLAHTGTQISTGSTAFGAAAAAASAMFTEFVEPAALPCSQYRPCSECRLVFCLIWQWNCANLGTVSTFGGLARRI